MQGPGRPCAGLAILCKDGQPQQKFEKGEHWPLGRWSHQLLPYAGGLHRSFNILGSVSSLGPRQVLLGGDWNFEPSDMPTDLVHGGQVVRPLSDEAATAPKGEKVKLDSFLTSNIFAPACGLEEATDLKPDHVAVRLPLQRDRLSTGFRGQAVYEEPQATEPGEVEAKCQAA
eukprot:5798955-Amphidinium_carterae.2